MPSSTPPVQGTGFINFQRYIDANKGAAQRLAQQMSQGISAEGEDARKHLSDAQDQFNRQLAAAQQPGATWQGPADITGLSTYQDGLRLADKAQQDAALEGTNYGRQALLQRTYGSAGGYGPGESAFDAALAGAGGAQASGDRQGSDYARLWNAYADNATSSANAASQVRAHPTPAATPAPTVSAGDASSPYQPGHYQGSQSQQTQHLQNKDQRGTLNPPDPEPLDVYGRPAKSRVTGGADPMKSAQGRGGYAAVKW